MSQKKKITLVMLPGLDGTGLVFDPLLSHLPDNINPQVVRYPADTALSFQEHVEFARKKLPKKEPFVLLAESFSGPIGLQLLDKPPANLIGVIFVATFARYPSPFLLDVGIYLPQSFLLGLFLKTPLGRFFCLGGAPASAVKIFQKALSSVKPNVLFKRLKIIAELPPPPDTTYSGPVLYLKADKDRMIPARTVVPFQQHLPQIQIQKTAGPHILLLAHPITGAKLISDFIDSLSDSP